MRPWALGDGHALHAVHAPLVLQTAHGPSPRPGEPWRARRRARPCKPPRSLSVASSMAVRQHTLLGVAEVHPQQVTAKSADSSPPSTALDLEDDVAVVVGVAWHEHPAQVLLRLGEADLEGGHLGGEGLVGRPRAHGRWRRVVTGRRSTPRAAATVGARAAYTTCSACARGPGRRARRGSASCSSSSAYSSRIDWTDSSTAGPSAQGRRETDRYDERRPPRPKSWEPACGRTYLGPSCRNGPRTGDAATGCRGSSACPCRTGGTASHVGSDLAGRLGAAGGERVATGAGDRGVHVVGVKVLLQDCLLEVVGGSESSLATVVGRSAVNRSKGRVCQKGAPPPKRARWPAFPPSSGSHGGGLGDREHDLHRRPPRPRPRR